MTRIKVSDNFYLDEFIDPWTYYLYGSKSLRYIAPQTIAFTQRVREILEVPCTINNWSNHGKLSAKEFLLQPRWKQNRSFKESGLRVFDKALYNKKLKARGMKGDALIKKVVGGTTSQHKFGRASDIKQNAFTSKDVHDIIEDYRRELMELGLTTLEHHEATRSWVHMDGRTTNLNDKLLIVRP